MVNEERKRLIFLGSYYLTVFQCVNLSVAQEQIEHLRKTSTALEKMRKEKPKLLELTDC